MSDLSESSGQRTPKKRSYVRQAKPKIRSGQEQIHDAPMTQHLSGSIVDDIRPNVSSESLSVPQDGTTLFSSNADASEKIVADTHVHDHFLNTVDAVQQWNARPDVFFVIRAVFKQVDKPYFFIERNHLNPDLQDVFEDGRIEHAVMRGEKIPTVEEYWIRIRKSELRRLQDAFGANAWFSDQLPQKKLPLLWGTLPPKKTGPDKDSQEYYFAKLDKNHKRTKLAYNSSEYFNPDLTF